LRSRKKVKKYFRREGKIYPAEGKWSVKEIIGHLIDSSINNARRIVVGQFQDNLMFPGYDQNSWVKVQNYQSLDWNYLIELWKLNNLHLIQIVAQIPESKLKKKYSIHNYDEIAWITVDKAKSVNLDYLIHDYLGHMKHYLNKIFKLIEN
jgi:hypothetical protein